MDSSHTAMHHIFLPDGLKKPHLAIVAGFALVQVKLLEVSGRFA